MALCRMCHWTFDEGLIGVSQVYEVITSRQLNSYDNLPSFLTNLGGRSIVGPSKEQFSGPIPSLYVGIKRTYF
jgi:putative restriction endonuclease